MKNFDVRVTWGLPGSGLARVAVVKTAASTEEIALSIARRQVCLEHQVTDGAEIREVRLQERT